jgi:hypothetical protein
MKQVFSKTRDYFKEQPYVVLVLAILVVSIGFNLYLLEQSNWLEKRKSNDAVQVLQNSETTWLESPWGIRNEIYTKYEDGKWKTYSTSTPITEEEILEMRRDSIERQKAMREYFRKQDELMREFWESFWW